MKFPIFITLVVFRFHDQHPEKLQIGFKTDTTSSLLSLPKLEWNGTSTLKAIAEHQLRQIAYADVQWLGVEEVGSIGDTENECVYSVWHSYVPDTVEINQQLEWIYYDKVEAESDRIMRADVVSLRRAING